MLSTVIPVYNEAASLDILYRELVQVADAQGYELDIIFVDDGSTDESWETIRRLAADKTLPRGVHIRLVLLLAYLAIPIDLIPDPNSLQI